MNSHSNIQSSGRWGTREGTPYPLGASLVETDQSFNFAIYSKHAERVTLVLFNESKLTEPCFAIELSYLSNKTGPVWHCRVSAAEAGAAKFYGYQVDGPAPGPGFQFHRFDYEKLLVDPYAREIFIPPGFSREAARSPGSNIGRAPLAVLPSDVNGFDWGDEIRPRLESDLVVYELHVRGFTRHASSGVDPERKGTFLGVCDKIPYLLELGITAVELMPVFQFGPDEENYWGYMPLALFAPHHGYCTRPEFCQQKNEFRTMVKMLHDAGIEVILDVVYNHTCEGDHEGPIYSMKGIDNSTYYVASGDRDRPYANFSGCGNTLHTANRNVRRLVVDSMRYWVEEMHVDGFRFDLASIFTRNSDGSINPDDPPIIGQIGAEDVLVDIRLIAEPWDATGVVQLGRNFPGMHWMQWNTSFRQCLQKYIRGDIGMVGELMTRVYGSCDLFPDDRFHAYRPIQSVNYVSSHDGLTMADLVAFTQKQNWANGQENRDGPVDYSCNCGWEGNENVPAQVLRLRKQQVKNAFCLLMLSAGTPMFRMGDEFFNTQNGNSNPYNQDNDTTWLDWTQTETHRDVLRFVRRLIAFRKSHPSICRSRFWREDVKWYGNQHDVDLSTESLMLAFCLHGQSEGDNDIYVMINNSSASVTFGIHEGCPGFWRRVIDTSKTSPEDIVSETPGCPVDGTSYEVAGRSVVVLVR